MDGVVGNVADLTFDLSLPIGCGAATSRFGRRQIKPIRTPKVQSDHLVDSVLVVGFAVS